MDRAGIKSVIAKYGETQGDLAEAIGLTPSALSLRINGKVRFSLTEVNRIRKRYKLSPEETVNIFFEDSVS